VIQLENVILPNKPLSNFEILDAVKKLIWKNLWRFLARHFAKETKKAWMWDHEPWWFFWKRDTLGCVVQTWKR